MNVTKEEIDQGVAKLSAEVVALFKREKLTLKFFACEASTAKGYILTVAFDENGFAPTQETAGEN